MTSKLVKTRAINWRAYRAKQSTMFAYHIRMLARVRRNERAATAGNSNSGQMTKFTAHGWPLRKVATGKGNNRPHASSIGIEWRGVYSGPHNKQPFRQRAVRKLDRKHGTTPIRHWAKGRQRTELKGYATNADGFGNA